MNNPISILRGIIAPPAAARGVIVDISGEIAKVATARGLSEYPAGEGLYPLDQVTITPSGTLIKSRQETAVYWL